VSRFAEIPVGELFAARGGNPTFVRDYFDAHPGAFPVYSASLAGPFGFIDSWDYQGRHLTWVMNGYGGRVREVAGQFSLTRDRGIFLPRSGVETPDLTYLRFALEPQLMAAAVGRRVDGRLNEYTKIYPENAESVVIRLPLNEAGGLDYRRMAEAGERLRRIELAQRAVSEARSPLARATFAVEAGEPATMLSLGDGSKFRLTIGERVLTSQHVAIGVPVYSANVQVPFGRVARSNLRDFSRPSLLWGIDGIFDWNLIPAEEEFATTDHCGRLVILDDSLDPEFVFAFLRTTRDRYGFDRIFRASLRNMKAEVVVAVPLDQTGQPSLRRQRSLAAEARARELAQIGALAALDDVLQAHMTAEP
jgi:hypothetical protein